MYDPTHIVIEIMIFMVKICNENNVKIESSSHGTIENAKHLGTLLLKKEIT